MQTLSFDLPFQSELELRTRMISDSSAPFTFSHLKTVSKSRGKNPIGIAFFRNSRDLSVENLGC